MTLSPSGLIGSVFSVLQFLSAPLTGAISDCLGRRPVMLLSLVWVPSGVVLKGPAAPLFKPGCLRTASATHGTLGTQVALGCCRTGPGPRGAVGFSGPTLGSSWLQVTTPAPWSLP